MFGVDARAARITWTVVLIALFCLFIYSIRHTLFVFTVSLLFAYLLLPLVDFIDRVLPLKRSGTPALAIVYLILVTVIVIGGIEIGARVAEQANNLAQKVTDFLKPEQPQSLPVPEPVKPMTDRVIAAARSAIQEHYQEILQKLPQAVLKGLSAAANLVFIVIVPILSFFFLKDGRAMQRYIVRQVENRIDQKALREIAAELNVLLAQ